jgi:hydrogenase expression/formation protein HypD
VTGTAEYEAAVAASGRSAVVAGFEPLDLLLGLGALARSSLRGEPVFENAYRRAVRPEGNRAARRVMQAAFRTVDAAWRGLGVLPASGFAIVPELRGHDARERFAGELAAPAPEGITIGAESARGCRCGDVMVGRIDPVECPLFAGACTPESPVGACMVSAEGTCRSRFVFREA